jgi:hypothetical protein
MITTKFHAILDYLSGIILLCAPWILGFNNVMPAMSAAVGAGIMVLAMSMLTNYEGGFIHDIKMKTHLAIDVILGILLALSPWLLKFSEYIYWPHLLMGSLAFLAGIFTKRSSSIERRWGQS